MKIKTAFLLIFVYSQNFGQDYKAVKDSLNHIFIEDQKIRRELTKLGSEHRWESETVKNLLNAMAVTDSLNLIKVENILNVYGWIGENKIGTQANTTLFLVIQHSGLKTQEKYLPMLRDAVNKGNATASSLAMLEDRIAVNKGELQIYASQIGRNTETGDFFVFPLADPENVDVRRQKMGLGSISVYVSRYGIEWNAEDYIKKLPLYLEIAKKIRETSQK